MIVDSHWHISAHFRFSFSGTLKCKMCLWYLMSVHVLSFHTHTYTINTAFKQAKVRLYKIKSKWCNQELHTHHVLFHHSQKNTKVNFPRDWKHFLDFVFLCWKSKDSQANLRYTHNPSCCATELLYSELTICADWEKLFKKKKMNRPISLWRQWSLYREGQRGRKLSSCPSFASRSAGPGFFLGPLSASGRQRQQLCEN